MKYKFSVVLLFFFFANSFGQTFEKKFALNSANFEKLVLEVIKLNPQARLFLEDSNLPKNIKMQMVNLNVNAVNLVQDEISPEQVVGCVFIVSWVNNTEILLQKDFFQTFGTLKGCRITTAGSTTVGLGNNWLYVILPKF